MKKSELNTRTMTLFRFPARICFSPVHGDINDHNGLPDGNTIAATFEKTGFHRQ